MFAFASLEKLERLMKFTCWRHFRETSFKKGFRHGPTLYMDL